ncbi:biotin/lipoyl-binding protein, partial [Candidatus Aerophobetes bacterium]|nr:biotin/lipoyl-binding protein [Candidatus Aerophobetes bacterium]
MRKKIFFTCFLIFIFVVGGSAFSQTEKKDTFPQIREISLTADIAPLRQVQIIPKVSGRLEEILVELGDSVEKDQVLAKIEQDDILLQLKQAEAALISAQANFEKVKSLARIQAENNLRTAESAFLSAKAQFNLTQATAETEFFAGLSQAQAALKIAQANLAKAERGAREEEIKMAEAAYQQALANFHTAQKNLQRAEDDYNRGAIPEQTLDQAKLSFEVAEAQLASAKANLELVKKGAREEDIQIAKANVQQAEAQVAKLESLKQAKSWEVQIQGAKTQFENAKSTFELAKVSWEEKLWEKDIELAKAQVQNAKAQFELARSRLDDCTIKSPISGIVSARFVDEGSMVGPTSPILTVVDISSVKIVLHVGQEVIDKIPLTQK